MNESKISGKAIVLTSIGFVVGVGEALIYYNMGQAQGNTFSFKFPPKKEFLKTMGMVLITSAVTTVLFAGIEMLMEDNKNDANRLAKSDK